MPQNVKSSRKEHMREDDGKRDIFQDYSSINVLVPLVRMRRGAPDPSLYLHTSVSWALTHYSASWEANVQASIM
jgi:hypothetical protein